jgi:hypothetical protein
MKISLKYVSLIATLLYEVQETFITRISTLNANENRDNNLRTEINPYNLTGFSDAEGCFSALSRREKKMKIG